VADKEYTIKYKIGSPARTSTGRPTVDYSVASTIKIKAPSEEEARKKLASTEKVLEQKKRAKANLNFQEERNPRIKIVSIGKSGGSGTSSSDDTTISARMIEPELVRPESISESRASSRSRNMSLRRNKGGMIDYRKTGLFK